MRVIITEKQLRRLAPVLKQIMENEEVSNGKPNFATDDDKPAFELIELIEKTALKNPHVVKVRKDMSPDTSGNIIDVFDTYVINLNANNLNLEVLVLPKALKVTKHNTGGFPTQDKPQPQVFSISDDVAEAIRKKCDALGKFSKKMTTHKEKLVADLTQQLTV